jgi:thiol-disulfide isomerase/thioredoxin
MSLLPKKLAESRIFQTLKPWIFYIGIFLVLRYTGAISAVSSVTQQAMMSTGAMDANPVLDESRKTFDYDFTLLDAERNKVDMNSLKGKTIFINVWATWCGPCRVEMPSIQKLYDEVGADKVAFIMLAVDQREPYKKVEAFIEEKKYTFPIYYPSGALPELLQVRSIPATFVISKEGKVVFREMGAANYGTDEFKDFLLKL